MTPDWSDISDEALGRRLGTELRRFPAPARLRAGLSRAGRRPAGSWLAPALSALATAAVLVLGMLTLLPARTSHEVVLRTVHAVVAEHSRALLWGARSADLMPQALARLAQESGIHLEKAFLGDDQLIFLGAEPVFLDWRRGVALHYLDPAGHRVTYMALHGARITMPERQRLQVDRFRPALVKYGGFAAWVWKQGDIACFVVSDLVSEAELPRFKDYFVRIRKETDPKLVY